MSALSSVTRQHAAKAVADALAAESCCAPSDFLADGVLVSELRPDRASDPLARRFPVLEDALTVTSTGTGVVVAATQNRMTWVSELFKNVSDSDEAFSLEVLLEALSEASRRVKGCSVRLNSPYAYNVTSEHRTGYIELPLKRYCIEVGGSELLAGLEPADSPARSCHPQYACIVLYGELSELLYRQMYGVPAHLQGFGLVVRTRNGRRLR